LFGLKNEFNVEKSLQSLSGKNTPSYRKSLRFPQLSKVGVFSFSEIPKIKYAKKNIKRDIHSRNYRNITILEGENGYIINNPDGREIAKVQDDYTVFLVYAEEIGRDMGLEPNPDTIQTKISYNPSNIVVWW
jgi:hypothetical protein